LFRNLAQATGFIVSVVILSSKTLILSQKPA